MNVNLEDRTWSEFYQLGLDAATYFAYIPDFPNEKNKVEFFGGLDHGMRN